MPWVVAFIVVLVADSATDADRPVILSLAFVMFAVSVWCSWAEDKRRRR